MLSLLVFLSSEVRSQPSEPVQPVLEKRKEENVLFIDALNTFYLRLYGVGYIVMDHI